MNGIIFKKLSSRVCTSDLDKLNLLCSTMYTGELDKLKLDSNQWPSGKKGSIIMTQLLPGLSLNHWYTLYVIVVISFQTFFRFSIFVWQTQFYQVSCQSKRVSCQFFPNSISLPKQPNGFLSFNYFYFSEMFILVLQES